MERAQGVVLCASGEAWAGIYRARRCLGAVHRPEVNSRATITRA
jgi:hypothetical protein